MHASGRSRETRDTAVHEARKSLKKLRALLRLVRPALGEHTYRRENVAFRDAARPLTEVRDAKILVETLDRLVKQATGRGHARGFTAIRNDLVHRQHEVRRRVLDEEDAFAEVTSAVQEALARLDDWASVSDQWPSVAVGVEEVYHRAQEAFAAARQDATVESLHEWRKQTKYLRHQLELLRPLWPEVLEPLAAEADHLGERLGDDHDLALLRHEVTSRRRRLGDRKSCERLIELIDQRREELQDEARLLGRRLLLDPPKTFRRRLREFLKVWQKLPVAGETVAAAS